ncbi:MAG: galactose-1-phosphate uridylyltransferase [Pseudomonadota bacterium]
MTDHVAELETQIEGKTVYRRGYTKADGRDLFLYGYAAHEEIALPESADEIAKGGELRWHPLRREWSVYAAHRQNRTYKPAAAANPLAPSVPGQPATEIPFTDFELAVFENKFTSFHPEASDASPIKGLTSKSARGRCEVVVYSPESEGSLATIGQERRRLLVAAWIDRYQALFDMGCAFVLPFESRGDEVGVTLHHPHGQIYGFPFVPQPQSAAVLAFDEGYDLAKDLAQFAPEFGVAEEGPMRAICMPYARFPFETWIAPGECVGGPWDFNEEALDAFAFLLGDITRRYDEYFGRATAYMLGLHAAPINGPANFHFTAQFYPILRAPDRVKFLASVEQHTSVMTVDVMPERAADTLRAL